MLGTVPVVSKWLTILEMRVHRERSRILCHAHRRVHEIAATVSSSTNQNKTISIFFSGEKTVAEFDLNYCQIKLANVRNNVSKAQSNRLIIVEMTCD